MLPKCPHCGRSTVKKLHYWRRFFLCGGLLAFFIHEIVTFGSIESAMFIIGLGIWFMQILLMLSTGDNKWKCEFCKNVFRFDANTRTK